MAARTGPHPDQPCGGQCGRMLKHNPRRKSTLCRDCSDAKRRLPDRFCRLCGKPRSKRKELHTGMCRSCAARSEKRIQALRVAMRQLHADPAFQARRGRALRNTLLAHIPPEYRDFYRELQRTTGMTKAERTQVIRNLMEADQREYLKSGILPQSNRSK